MEQEGLSCNICSETLNEDNNTWVLSCGHVLCSSCIDEDLCPKCEREESLPLPCDPLATSHKARDTDNNIDENIAKALTTTEEKCQEQNMNLPLVTQKDPERKQNNRSLDSQELDKSDDGSLVKDEYLDKCHTLECSDKFMASLKCLVKSKENNLDYSNKTPTSKSPCKCLNYKKDCQVSLPSDEDSGIFLKCMSKNNQITEGSSSKNNIWKSPSKCGRTGCQNCQSSIKKTNSESSSDCVPQVICNCKAFSLKKPGQTFSKPVACAKIGCENCSVAVNECKSDSRLVSHPNQIVQIDSDKVSDSKTCKTIINDKQSCQVSSNSQDSTLCKCKSNISHDCLGLCNLSIGEQKLESCETMKNEKLQDSEKSLETRLEEIDKKMAMLHSVQQEVESLKHQQAEDPIIEKDNATPDKTGRRSREDASVSNALRLSLEKLQLDAKIAKITSTIAQTLTEVDELHASAKQSIEEKLLKDNRCRCRCDSSCSDLDHYGATIEKSSCGDENLIVSLTTTTEHSSATKAQSSSKEVSYASKNEHSPANDDDNLSVSLTTKSELSPSSKALSSSKLVSYATKNEHSPVNDDDNQSVSLTTKTDHFSATKAQSPSKEVSYANINEHSLANDDGELSSNESTFGVSHVAKMECSLSSCGGPKKMLTSSFITNVPLSDLVSKLPSGNPTMYQPNIGTDLMMKNGILIQIQTKWEIITAMDKFKDKSLEELRLEHHSEHKNSFIRFGQDKFSFCNGKSFDDDNDLSGFQVPKCSLDFQHYLRCFQAPKCVPLSNLVSKLPFGEPTMYQPNIGIDLITKNGSLIPIQTKLENISVMNDFKNKSLEELRLEHYSEHKKSFFRFGQNSFSFCKGKSSDDNAQSGFQRSPQPFVFDKRTENPFQKNVDSCITFPSESNPTFNSSPNQESENSFPSVNNTNPQFSPTVTNEVMIFHGIQKHVKGKINAITLMKEYESMSFEELRFNTIMDKRNPKGTSRHITRRIKIRVPRRRSFSESTLSPFGKTTFTSPQSTTKFGENPTTKFGENPTTKFGENPTTKFGENPTMNFGENPTSKFGENPTMKFGENPTSKFGENPTTKFGENPTTKFGENPIMKFGENPITKFGENPTIKFCESPTTKFGESPTAKFGENPTTKFGKNPTTKFGEIPFPFSTNRDEHISPLNKSSDKTDPEGFVVKEAPRGTSVKFKQPIIDSYLPSQKLYVKGRFEVITAMFEYMNKSLEELRLEDYLAKSKGGEAPRLLSIST